MKKILFVAPSAYPLGGVQEWLDYLLPGLESNGWECTLGLVDGLHHDVDAYLVRHPWANIARLTNPTGSREGRIQALVSAIRRIGPSVLVVANIVDTYGGVRRLRLAGEPTPRMVATLHALQSDLLVDMAAEADVIDAVVATNRLSARLVGQALGSVDRVFYAPYGVPLPDNSGKPISHADGILRLLYCGRLEEGQKRAYDLADLLASLCARGVSTVLDVAGGGPDEAALRARFEAVGVHDQVRFLGVLNPRQLAEEYRRHDALVITSSWETGPIVAWEAMSHGLPVVSSRYVGSGAEDALKSGENCLLFDVGDVDGAACAIESLRDRVFKEKLMEGGYSLIRERYSREISVMQWTEALQKILYLPPLGTPAPPSLCPPSGRLDRLLGAETGEKVRRILGIRFLHSEAGGEWPHSGHAAGDQSAFLEEAACLDLPE